MEGLLGALISLSEMHMLQHHIFLETTAAKERETGRATPYAFGWDKGICLFTRITYLASSAGAPA